MDGTPTETFENLIEIIDDFNIAMLVSISTDNEIHARPMSIAEHDEDTGVMYFATSVETGKTDEIERDPRVNITLQSSSSFVSLSGKATVLNDRQLISDMFEDSWRAWFPEGPQQDDIRLIKFDPDRGEYWDMSGLKGLKFLWEAGKAVARDEEVDYNDPDNHARVNM